MMLLFPTVPAWCNKILSPMKISERKYGSPKGEITWIELENEGGASVVLSTLGAGIVEVRVPDKNGKIENVALSYAQGADYLYDGACLGKCPGRYANRIAKGQLKIDGKSYQLAVNNGPNALHGGPDGFQNRIWDYEIIGNGVIFRYHASDGEENYPANLDVEAKYVWNESNELSLEFKAKTDAPTVVNLTNHAYWNLSGADAGSILDHEMQIDAEIWLPTDSTQIPTGELASVADTPMDFRNFKKIGKDINADFEALKIGKGYDHCWAVAGWNESEVKDVVKLRSLESGRTLTVSSDQPGVQVYTGNWLSGSPKNRSGRSYEDYEGVAIEMQGFPDAPNKPRFPSQLLLPEETYTRKIIFKFG